MPKSLARMTARSVVLSVLREDRLIEVLELTGWNRSKAASVLGVSEGTIRNRIKKYGLR